MTTPEFTDALNEDENEDSCSSDIDKTLQNVQHSIQKRQRKIICKSIACICICIMIALMLVNYISFLSLSRFIYV